jgi:FkbM family methyltransferase
MMNFQYYSQFKQDQFLNEVLFNNKKNGFFIDIGAHDGVTISNTLFFEKQNEWKGICIEPNPKVFAKLDQNRKSLNLNVCIGNENGIVKFTQIDGYSEMLSGISGKFDQRHEARIDKEIAAKGGQKNEIDIPMITLDSIDNIAATKIDFISIDTEGNEFEIIKAIDFKTLDITAFVIENNYGDNRIKEYLAQFNYQLLHKLDCDEVFMRADTINSAVRFRLFLWKSSNLLTKVFRKIGLK